MIMAAHIALTIKRNKRAWKNKYVNYVMAATPGKEKVLLDENLICYHECLDQRLQLIDSLVSTVEKNFR